MKKILSLLMLLVAIVIGAKAADVKVTYALAKDDAFTSGQSVNVKNSSNETVATITYGESGGADFKAASEDSQVSGFSAFTAGNGTNGNKTGGTFYTIVPVYDGTIDVAVQLNADKSFHINEDGTDMEGYAGIKVTEKYYGTYTFTVKAGSSYKVWCDGSKLGFYGFNYTYSDGDTPVGPTITTQPQNAEYVISSTTYPSMSVEAEASEGTLSYQWELSTDGENFKAISTEYVPSAATATLLGSEALDVLTVDEPTTYYFKCKVTDSNGDVYTDVATLKVIAGAPTITTNLEAAYNVNKGSTLELSIVAEDASSYQWYVDDAAVAGATSDSYTYSATTIGSVAVYCATTNAAGTTNSATATVTTVGSSACKLINVKYSNGFYAWITQPYTDKDGNDINTGVYTIDSYYMEGEAVPTIDESSIEVSANATWAIADGKLTVTAEDETTKSVFTINEPVAVTPLEGSGNYTMYASDTYVKARYGYKNESGKIGWGMAKSTEEDVNPRISSGNSRMTIFLAEGNTKLTIKGSSTSDRNVDVFVNGTQVVSDKKLAKKGGTVDINLTAAKASTVVISNRGNGDLHIQSITITPETAPATETITVDGVATYITKNALDFTTVTGLTAYAVTGVNEAKTSVTTEAVTTVPAGTALLVKGATADVPVVESAGEITNLLKESNGTIKGADNVFAYSKSALKFKKVATTVTIPAGKAYLVIEGVSGDALDLDFEGEATAVDAIAEADEAEAAPVKVIKNGKLYIGNFNVAGQQVK